jgi:hypothetical protein
MNNSIFEKQKVFKYTKREISWSLLGILAGIIFLFFGVYEPRSKNFIIHNESFFMIVYYMFCFIMIFYFFNFWLRRRGFLISIDDLGLTISRLDKMQKISWNNIKSYVYQGGRPYWFISLRLVDGKHINIHGKLENFGELVKLVKNKIRPEFREFQYTLRKKLSFIFSIYSILAAGIMIGIPLTSWVVGRKSVLELLEFIILAVVLFGWGLLYQLYNSHIKIVVGNESLTMKPWFGKPILIPWPEIKENSQIEFGRFQSTIVARIDKINIRTKDKLISFCEDIDNFDELVDIIKTKTGVLLSV